MVSWDLDSLAKNREDDKMADMFGLNLQGMLPNFGAATQMIYDFAIAAVVCIAMWFITQYKHRVTIFHTDATGYMRTRSVQWARRFKDRKEKVYKLHLLQLNRKVIDQFQPIAGGFGLKYNIFEDDNGHFHNMKFKWDDINKCYEVRVIPSNVLVEQTQELNELNQDYATKTWWEKWGQIVLPLIFIVGVSIVFLYGLDKMNEMLNSSQTILHQATVLYEKGCAANIQSVVVK